MSSRDTGDDDNAKGDDDDDDLAVVDEFYDSLDIEGPLENPPKPSGDDEDYGIPKALLHSKRPSGSIHVETAVLLPWPAIRRWQRNHANTVSAINEVFC